MANVTIKDIATRVGVSAATVSMALRNDSRISEATRERILKTANELGYVPNPMVASLMTQIRTRRKVGKGSTLAMLGPSGLRDLIENKQFDYSRNVQSAIRRRSAGLGYHVELFSADGEGESVEQLARVSAYRGIRGVILPPWPHHMIGKVCDFDRGPFAAVAIGDSQSLEHPIHRVAHDQFTIIYNMMRTVIARGYRRIGLFVQREFHRRTGSRYASAFFGALNDYLPESLDQRFLFLSDRSYQHDDFVEWVKREQLDCVITQYPDHYHILRDIGMTPPAKIGFAMISTYRADSAVSGMYHDPFRIGSVAVDVVTAHIQRNEYGVPDIPKTTLIEPTWIEGETLRPEQA